MGFVEGVSWPARLLVGTAGVISAVFLDDGAPAAASSMTVTVTDGVGTAVVTAGDVTEGTAPTYVNTFTFTPAQLGSCKQLTAVWSATVGGQAQTLTTRHEVVGDLLFTLAEARTWQGGKLIDQARYPAAMLLAARDGLAEDLEETILGYAVGTRWAREVRNGRSEAAVLLPHQKVTRVIAAAQRLTGGSSDWTALDADDLEDLAVESVGLVTRETRGVWAAGRQNIRIEYEHGMQPIARSLRDAALTLLVDQLVASNVTQRALTETTDYGSTFRLAIAGGAGRWFGIPSVDATLQRFSEKVPGFA